MEKPVAIVTGAGRGIGRATAVELAARGHRLVLVARTPAQLAETASLLRDMSLEVVADVSLSIGAQRVVDEALAQFGRVDVVVNNAGAAPAATLAETDDATWRKAIDANLSSAFFMTRAAWPALMRSRGCVVNLGSVATRDPLPGFGAYAAAKAGINALTLMTHREGREHGIRAYAIAPGSTETAMLRSIVSADVWPRSNCMEPEDVARAIAACVTGELRYASGEVIYLGK